MQYWLVKSEPDVWSLDQQEKVGAKGATWDGVRNYQAANNLKKMKIGDLCYFYHSNIGKEIVGVVEVIKKAFIDKTKLALMKKDSVIINTSRGPIIKELDLINAVNTNKISGAALDVFDLEPLPRDHILRKTKNILLTPHIGYVSVEAYEKFFQGYVIAIDAFLKGKPINKITIT